MQSVPIEGKGHSPSVHRSAVFSVPLTLGSFGGKQSYSHKRDLHLRVFAVCCFGLDSEMDLNLKLNLQNHLMNTSGVFD